MLYTLQITVNLLLWVSAFAALPIHNGSVNKITHYLASEADGRYSGYFNWFAYFYLKKNKVHKNGDQGFFLKLTCYANSLIPPG